MAILVAGLALTPVKGTRLRPLERVMLGPTGVRENRRFFLIDARDRMVNAKRIGELQRVIADYVDDERRLRLTLPDGDVIEGVVRVGEEVAARFFSGTLNGRLVNGRFSDAISQVAGEPLRLVEAPDADGAVDRLGAGHVSLISRASLARLAEAGTQPVLDSRRFRMLVEIDGVRAHAEDRWVGYTVRLGEASVAFTGHVGRCLVTSRDPDSGMINLPTLDILRGYREDALTTEPLPFGIYGHVLAPGQVVVGDEVIPGDRLASR